MIGLPGCRVASGVAWRVWDGEVVVYVQAHRVTHLLSHDASRLFMDLIDQKAAGQDAYGDAAGHRTDFSKDSDYAAAQATLLEFAALGIVDRA